MSTLQGDPLEGVVEQLRAPVSRHSIDERVQLFERRINGRILPFLGLHGTLLALVYLIENSSAVAVLSENHALLPALTLGVPAALCSLLVASFHFTGRARDVSGGTAVACCLGLLTALLLPFDGALAALPLSAAVALCLMLLALNATGKVSDYDFNTVWLYLPLIVLVVGRPSGVEQMIVAIAVYGPAIYVKFGLQRAANKVPLGFSVLVFLSLIIEDNGESEGLIAAMVLLVLALFVVSSFRMRHVTGSSYRYFLADTIIMGLWAVLVGLMGHDDESTSIFVWGLGVAAYQGLAFLLLARKQGMGDSHEARALTERDARLVWLQIATVTIFGELVIESVLERQFGIDKAYVGLLIIIAPFIPLFCWLRTPLLALATRLWIGGCLVFAAVEASSQLAERYTVLAEGQTLEDLRAAFVDSWASELTWLVLAFLVALAATRRIAPAYEVAWWRGLIRARHVVLLRRCIRLVIANASRIAFVGGFISAAAALVNWMRYASGGATGQRSQELLLVGAHVYAVAITTLFFRYALGCCDAAAYPPLAASPLSFAGGDGTFVLACCLWGTLLYLRGVMAHDYLARFFAAAFVVTPIATFSINNTWNDTAFFAEVALACCFALFGFGLFRRLAR